MAGAPAIREKLTDMRKRSHLKENTPGALTPKEKDRIPAYEVALEMYVRGFNIKNINLERSEATKFIISDKGLIPPFSVIEGMGEIMAKSIVEARTITPFTSKEDLKNRTKVSVGHLETMNKMGITDKLEDDNQMTMDSFFD
jgi:DNA polymerase-3 subunit alpha (Gram-positive type)